MLGLRTKQGVNKAVVNAEAAQRYIEQGLLIEQEGKIIATTTGMHVLNRVIEDLLF
jgi:coproporphyrinogen III oxidase-like Fe-S oxidoreductase